MYNGGGACKSDRHFYLELQMSKVFTSRTNGLELHIPADMGAAVRFFSVGEDARRIIDDGSTSTRTNDPDQMRTELARAQARVAALEAQAAASAEAQAAASAETKVPAPQASKKTQAVKAVAPAAAATEPALD
jgi:sRNA-binding protein